MGVQFLNGVAWSLGAALGSIAMGFAWSVGAAFGSAAARRWVK